MYTVNTVYITLYDMFDRKRPYKILVGRWGGCGLRWACRDHRMDCIWIYCVFYWCIQTPICRV